MISLAERLKTSVFSAVGVLNLIFIPPFTLTTPSGGVYGLIGGVGVYLGKPTVVKIL